MAITIITNSEFLFRIYFIVILSIKLISAMFKALLWYN